MILSPAERERRLRGRTLTKAERLDRHAAEMRRENGRGIDTAAAWRRPTQPQSQRRREYLAAVHRSEP